jgi:hypothetical protein
MKNPKILISLSSLLNLLNLQNTSQRKDLWEDPNVGFTKANPKLIYNPSFYLGTCPRHCVEAR